MSTMLFHTVLTPKLDKGHDQIQVLWFIYIRGKKCDFQLKPLPTELHDFIYLGCKVNWTPDLANALSCL